MDKRADVLEGIWTESHVDMKVDGKDGMSGGHESILTGC